MGRFMSSFQMACLIFAEKGPTSTSDLCPVQQDYRSAEDWEIYSRNLAVMQQSKRPHLLRSNGPAFVPDVIGGHLLIDTEFNAVSPVMAAPAEPPVQPPARGLAKWLR